MNIASRLREMARDPTIGSFFRYHLQAIADELDALAAGDAKVATREDVKNVYAEGLQAGMNLAVTPVAPAARQPLTLEPGDRGTAHHWATGGVIDRSAALPVPALAPQTKIDIMVELHRILGQHGIASLSSRDQFSGLPEALVTWAADACRQSQASSDIRPPQAPIIADRLDRVCALMPLLLDGVTVVVFPESSGDVMAWVALSREVYLVSQGPTADLALVAWQHCFVADVLMRTDPHVVAFPATPDDVWQKAIANGQLYRAALTASAAPPPGETPEEKAQRSSDIRPIASPITGPGTDRIATERQRQISQEGWTPEHDDSHENGELLAAACWYLDSGCEFDLGLSLPAWPFEPSAWKPSGGDYVRQLVKAGALIAAEIDRIQRRDALTAAGETPPPASPVWQFSAEEYEAFAAELVEWLREASNGCRAREMQGTALQEADAEIAALRREVERLTAELKRERTVEYER